MDPLGRIEEEFIGTRADCEALICGTGGDFCTWGCTGEKADGVGVVLLIDDVKSVGACTNSGRRVGNGECDRVRETVSGQGKVHELPAREGTMNSSRTHT